MQISDFPRILTHLRKEKGVSQKEAAEALGVSQSLLSHYEKGVRECGLVFLVRAADYYDVTVDYILGRSYEKDGKKISLDELPEDIQSKGNSGIRSMLPTLNKKLINNSVSIIMDVLSSVNNKKLTTEVSNYLDLAVYRVFRMLYNSNADNMQDVFGADMEKYQLMTSSAMDKCLVEILKTLPEDDDRLLLDFADLKSRYPDLSASLFNLLQSSETQIGARKK